ncbi:MAG TPA: hypothetical protein VN112_25135 [Ensifer sp.]|nr:hypothetical protein [Ensifer sp.]
MPDSRTDFAVVTIEEVDDEAVTAAIVALAGSTYVRKQTASWAGDNSVFYLLLSPEGWASIAAIAFPIWWKIVDKVGDKLFDKGFDALWSKLFPDKEAKTNVEEQVKVERLYRELENLRAQGVEVAIGLDIPAEFVYRDGMFQVASLESFANTAAFYMLAGPTVLSIINTYYKPMEGETWELTVLRQDDRRFEVQICGPRCDTVKFDVTLVENAQLELSLSVNQLIDPLSERNVNRS